MTSTEQLYAAQIEKEAPVITWACDRLTDYLIGMKFHVESNYKLLVQLISTKLLDDLPLFVQPFK